MEVSYFRPKQSHVLRTRCFIEKSRVGDLFWTRLRRLRPIWFRFKLLVMSPGEKRLEGGNRTGQKTEERELNLNTAACVCVCVSGSGGLGGLLPLIFHCNSLFCRRRAGDMTVHSFIVSEEGKKTEKWPRREQ